MEDGAKELSLSELALLIEGATALPPARVLIVGSTLVGVAHVWHDSARTLSRSAGAGNPVTAGHGEDSPCTLGSAGLRLSTCRGAFRAAELAKDRRTSRDCRCPTRPLLLAGTIAGRSWFAALSASRQGSGCSEQSCRTEIDEPAAERRSLGARRREAVPDWNLQEPHPPR